MKRLSLIDVRSQAPTFAIPAPGTPVYIAIDVARSKWAYAVRWEGKERWRQSSPGEMSHLLRLIERYPGCPMTLVYEACGFGYEIAWQLEQRGVKVVVTPPSCLERVAGRRVKTDKIDARKLALELEKNDLKAIYVPSRTLHQHRAPIRTYRQVMRERSRSSARIRLLMQEQGRIGPLPSHGWKCYATWLARQDLPPTVQVCLKHLLAQRAVADKSIGELRTLILELGRLPDYAPFVKALSEQPGVGQFSATVFVLEIGDIGRFTTADSIAHYLGLTPSEYSSGETEHRGTIMKCGPGAMRALLIQCAWAAVRPSGEQKLREVYERLVPKCGKKRAIVAVARRLSLRLRARWLEVLAAPAAIKAA